MCYQLVLIARSGKKGERLLQQSGTVGLSGVLVPEGYPVLEASVPASPALLHMTSVLLLSACHVRSHARSRAAHTCLPLELTCPLTCSLTCPLRARDLSGVKDHVGPTWTVT